MTSSRSSRWLIVLACLGLWATSAFAGRKRLVVLEFDGPSAEKFHADVVKLIKKNHTVITVDKWNTAAEELGAEAVTDKNVKKVAKKLKIDGVVTGKIEKRRDEYIVRVKLRAGTTGTLTPNPVQTKSGDARLDAQSQRDLKDELLPAIEELAANHGGGDEEEEEEAPPPKKKKVVEEEEEAPPPKKSGFAKKNGDKKVVVEEEEEAPPPPPKTKKLTKAEEKAAKKKADEEERAALATKKDKEEEEEEAPKKRAKKSEDEEETKTAAAEEEEEETDKVEEEEEAPDTSDKALAVSPSRRAVDAAIGLSFTRRNLSFSYESTLGKPPPGYRQLIPVAGAFIDLTVFPLSFDHKPGGLIKGLGVTALYDRVLIINSQKKYADAAGMQQTADLKTEEERWAVGLVLRYPLGKEASSAVVGGQLTYGQQKFLVAQELPNMEKTDIPNVQYSMLSPGGFIRFPVTPKIILNADLAFHLVLNSGPMADVTQYGKATVLGFDAEVGGDYMIKTNIFLRAMLRFELISHSFQGDAMSQTHTRDTDPEQDVMGAQDQYMGAQLVVGYLF